MKCVLNKVSHGERKEPFYRPDTTQGEVVVDFGHEDPRAMGFVGPARMVSIIRRELVDSRDYELLKVASSMYSQRCPLLTKKFNNL